MRKSLRKEVYIVIGIFILAFAFRLIYLTQLRSSPYFDTPPLDAEYHDQWAQNILKGEDFDDVYFRAPLYPYFLALIYRIFSQDYLAPRLIQFIIGALSCVLVYLLGKKVFGERAGGISGIIASFYGILIYFEGELLIPVLIVFLNLLMILSFFWAKDKPSAKRWFLCGALLGFSAIARPNILLVGAVFFLWILIRLGKNAKIGSKSVIYAGCFLLGAILVISPVTLRNHIKGKDFVLIASQGGMNFFIGNNPQSDGISVKLPGARLTWWGLYEDSKRLAEEASQRSLKPSQVSSFWYKQGLKFLTQDPAGFFKLMLRKFILFWNGAELSNNRDLYYFAESVPFLKLLLWRYIIYFPFGLIAPLAIVGIILSHKEKKDVAPLEMFLFAYAFSIIMFFVNSRFRVPVVPILILFAGYALSWFFSRIKRGDFIRIWKYLLILVVLLIAVNLRVRGYGATEMAHSHYSAGVLWTKKGDITRAIEEFKKTLEYNPHMAEAYSNLGAILGNMGRHNEALVYFQKALENGGDSAFILSNIGYGYHVRGLLEPAQENYRLSIDARDNDPEVHYLLADVYFQQGMLEAAVEEYEKTIELDPKHAKALYGLGTIQYQLGRKEEAISNLEEFLRLWEGEPVRTEKVAELLEKLKGGGEP